MSMIEKGKDKNNEDGFVLIALSIALVILGLILGSYVYIFNTQEEMKRQEKTNLSFTTVANRMASYFSINRSYPCPARRNEAPGDPDYGKATDCTNTTVSPGSCSASSDYCVTTRLGKRIRIGIVPFKSLGIDKNDAVDAYGNFFTYALTEPQGVPVAYVEDGGTIQMDDRDAAGVSTMRDVDFVLISHGPDGRGSFNRNGIISGFVCSGSHDDVENCDNDAGFLSKPYSNTNDTNHFDDQAEFRLQDWVYIWDTAYQSYKTSFNRGFANIGVGTGINGPTEKLHIGGGGNLRIENGNLHTKDLCKSSGLDCFSPNVLGGTVSQSEGMSCSSGKFMTDIRNGGPICSYFYGNGSTNCPTDSFISEMSYAAGSGTINIECTNTLTGSTTPKFLN